MLQNVIFDMLRKIKSKKEETPQADLEITTPSNEENLDDNQEQIEQGCKLEG